MALLKFKRSAVPAKIPSIADLALGELAINTYDGKVYTKKDDGTESIVEVGGTASTTNTILLPVRNNTGATLTKGTAVYINGALGQNPTVTKAIATSDATSAQTLGLVSADLPNNTVGNVTLIGSLDDVNTSAYTDGQQLYLSPTTAGTLTATKPYAPNHLVYIAVVEHAHPTHGKLFVKVQNGYEMDELHDVSAQSPANNDGLFYNTTSGLWEKKSIATALGYTPASTSGPTFSNGITVNNGGNQVQIAYDGNLEIVRADGNGYIDFKNTIGEDFDSRIQQIGSGFAMSGTVSAGDEFRAPIFRDTPNTAYYLDPASTSNLSGITLDGTLTGVTGRFAKNQTAGNYTTAALWTESYGSTATGIAFHISGNVGKFLEMRTDQILYWPGILNSDGELRAPIFRDMDNGAYYVDPAGTSNLNNLTLNTGPVYRSDWTTRFQSGSDFVDGTLVTTDIPATGFAGESFIIEITGKSYSASNLPFKIVAQGYLYNDTIINYTGISYGGDFATYIKVFEQGGVLKFWWPRISYWNSFNVNVMAMDGPTNNTITRNRVTAIGNSTEPTGTKKQQITLSRFMRGDVSATNSVDVRAPIFYDSPNSAYHVDPAGTSNLNQVNLGDGTKFIRGGGAGQTILGVGGVNEAYLQVGGSYYSIWNAGNFNPASYLPLSGGTISGVLSIQSSNDAQLYLNGNGTSWAGIQWNDVSGGDNMWYNGSTSTFAIGGGGSFVANKKLHINGGTTIGSNLALTAVATNGLLVETQISAPIFYDSPDTSWFLDPSSTSVLNVVRANAIQHVNGTSAITLTDGSYLYFKSPDNGVRLYLGGADPANYYDNDTHYFRNRASTIRAELTNADGFKVGPNSSGQYTRLGGNGGAADMCTVSASNGNFHIDAKTGNNLYLSWYNVATTYVGGEIAATVFRDRDNSEYYLDPTSTGLALKVNGNMECYARSAAWSEGYRVRVPSRSTWGGIRFTRDDANSNGNWAIGFTGIDSTDDLTFWGNLNGTEGMRARLTHGGNFSITNAMVSYSYQGNGNVGGTGSASWHPSGIYSAGYNWLYGGISAGGGDITGVNAVYAGAYYDSPNTAYYVDPASESNLNITRTYIGARDVNANWATGFQNTPPYTKAYHGDISTGGPAGTWWFYESMRHSNASNYWGTQIAWGWEDNSNRLMQRNVSGNSFSAWVEYLSTGGRTYSGGLEMTGIIQSSADLRAPIFYDRNDTSTYIDPNGASWIKGGIQISRVSPAGDNDCFGGLELREVSLVANTQTAATYSPRVNFHWGAIAAATIFMNSSGNFVFGGQGDITNNRRSIFCNELYATGNVTAYYSDDRLKTRIGNIENALDIVSSLNGFRYVDNELAKTFGYTNENGQIGVSAQEVQKHLPEIVRPAAFDVDHDNPDQGSKTGENYLTVDYSRLVPLLIEAIKELRDEVEALKK
jgi:hypothetical protein